MNILGRSTYSVGAQPLYTALLAWKAAKVVEPLERLPLFS
jgi:hypothetical protein